MLWRPLCLCLLLPALASAADLQYRIATLRVTGLYDTQPAQVVPGHATVPVPEDFLATLPWPVACGPIQLTELTIATLSPLTFTGMPQNCLAGEVLHSKTEVDAALTRALEPYQRKAASVAAICPATNLTPACTRMRSRGQFTQQEIDAADAIQTLAETLRNRLP